MIICLLFHDRRNEGQHPVKSLAGLEQRWRFVVGQGSGSCLFLSTLAHAHLIPLAFLEPVSSLAQSSRRMPLRFLARGTGKSIFQSIPVFPSSIHPIDH